MTRYLHGLACRLVSVDEDSDDSSGEMQEQQEPDGNFEEESAAEEQELEALLADEDEIEVDIMGMKARGPSQRFFYEFALRDVITKRSLREVGCSDNLVKGVNIEKYVLPGIPWSEILDSWISESGILFEFKHISEWMKALGQLLVYPFGLNGVKRKVAVLFSTKKVPLGKLAWMWYNYNQNGIELELWQLTPCEHVEGSPLVCRLEPVSLDQVSRWTSETEAMVLSPFKV